MTWPDVERSAVSRLLAESWPTDVGTIKPAGDRNGPPVNFTRITVVSGTDNYVTESVVIDIDVFHTSRAEAFSLAEKARQFMLAQGGRADSAGVLWDRVTTVTRPVSANVRDRRMARVRTAVRVEQRPLHE